MDLSKFVVNGIEGYYTSLHINQNRIPQGWRKYAITFSDEDSMDLANIQKHAICNRCYDFITTFDLDPMICRGDGIVPVNSIQYLDDEPAMAI